MDKVEDIVGRLRGDDDLSARIEAADLIQSQQALIEEMREALEGALQWIDAVPDETQLPAMPGFDRDHVDCLVYDARKALSQKE